MNTVVCFRKMSKQFFTQVMMWVWKYYLLKFFEIKIMDIFLANDSNKKDWQMQFWSIVDQYSYQMTEEEMSCQCSISRMYLYLCL